MIQSTDAMPVNPPDDEESPLLGSTARTTDATNDRHGPTRSQLGGLVLASVLIFIGCVLEFISISKSDMSSNEQHSARFEVAGFIINFILSCCRISGHTHPGFVLCQMGLVFRLASDGDYVSWSNTNVARIAGSSDQGRLWGSILCWTGTLVATLIAFAPGTFSARDQRVQLWLGVSFVISIIGVLLLWLSDTSMQTPPPFDGAVTTLFLQGFALFGGFCGQDSVALGSGTLVLIGATGWFLLQEIFYASMAGDNRPGTVAGFALCWLALMGTACVLDWDTHVSPNKISTQQPPAVQRARWWSRALFIAFGILLIVPGFVLGVASIAMHDLVGASAHVATFDVCTITLVYCACAVWTFALRRRGIILLLMGVMFQLAKSGPYLGWATINNARVAITANPESTKQQNQMHVAASILLWVGTMWSTAVVWAPNDSNIKTRVQELRFPFIGAVLGVIFLWVGDNSVDIVQFQTASITILLQIYAILALVGQERVALSSGALVLTGSNGWFVLQRVFDADAHRTHPPLLTTGFVLCWLSLMWSAKVVISDSKAYGIGDTHATKEGKSLDEFKTALRDFGVNDKALFSAEVNDKHVKLNHTKISLWIIYLGTWSVTLEGLNERAVRVLGSSQLERPLGQVIGDLIVLSNHELLQWEASNESNVFRARMKFKAL